MLIRLIVLLIAVASFYGMILSGQESPQTGAGALATSTVTMAPAPQWTATAIAALEPAEHNILHRPIELSDHFVHWIDRTYLYGGTQFQTRAVHLGVEFVNPRNTPVYAAKAGVVVYAGDDAATLLGPQHDYYGNVVVLAHAENSLAGRPVFTLYGHLEAVEVQAGWTVDDLDRIGRIGSSGVALGPHLHFEVRVEDPFDYRKTRNPELWLQHYVDRGMIAGSLRDEAGNLIHGRRISVRSDSTYREVFSYGGVEVNPDPVWRENFTVGDLPAAQYEVIVLHESGAIAYAADHFVEAYRTTYVDIVIGEG